MIIVLSAVLVEVSIHQNPLPSRIVQHYDLATISKLNEYFSIDIISLAKSESSFSSLTLMVYTLNKKVNNNNAFKNNYDTNKNKDT